MVQLVNRLTSKDDRAGREEEEGQESTQDSGMQKAGPQKGRPSALLLLGLGETSPDCRGFVKQQSS